MRDLSAKNQTNNNKRPPPPSITQAPVFALQLKKVFFRSWYEFSPLEDPLKKRITFAIFLLGSEKTPKKL
jgi:phenylpropionate dioxygenase-like ring-hydroxylating dioxygenase large terminal subunit